MAFKDRILLIKEIEKLRGSTVACFLTSLRQNVTAQISDDAVRVFFDHLLLFPSRPVEKFDLFLCSNGGSGTVPWRLVSLFREYAKNFNVLIPYRSYSAATLIALGADEIVMHPFAELGPIDPTVSNEFNPIEQPSGRRLGISVEDVKAYVNFIKTTVGITHQDELIKAVEALTEKVHPLALGNVERFLAQSRMIARKILRTHMNESEEHTIEDIIENMASKLYFHGHPINRKEAKEDLRLKVNLKLPGALESLMWTLYKDFEEEFQNQSIFAPAGDLAAQTPPAPSVPVQMPLPGNPQMQQLAMLAQAAQTAPVQKEYELLHAIVESARLSSSFTTYRRYRLFAGVPAQPVIQEDILKQGWNHSSAPTAESGSQPRSSSLGDEPTAGGPRQDMTGQGTQPELGRT